VGLFQQSADEMIERKHTAYDPMAKMLHWLVLGLLIAQFVFGWTMPHIGRSVPSSLLIDWHVWLGVMILLVAIIRLLWRFTHGEPEPEAGVMPWQTTTARIIHWLLYGLLFTLPILGWLNASWRGMPVTFFGAFELPKLLATRVPGWGWTGDVHTFLADYVLLPLVGIHVAAALYHYFVRRDRVLQRMLPSDLL
jgi:cytochrome b561